MKRYIKMYHVFADRFDDYVKTVAQYKQLIRMLKNNGEENIRVYRQCWNADEELVSENCVYSLENFPQ